MLSSSLSLLRIVFAPDTHDVAGAAIPDDHCGKLPALDTTCVQTLGILLQNRRAVRIMTV